jgi:alkanesulfonate monooxygenase SsuD/methylene tetrahydromethanopterin reductase-like flavin-dependent oxidoreductase (luciferase family)
VSVSGAVTGWSYGSGVRTGVSLPPFTDPGTVVALAVEAEQSGWDGVFVWDHLVFQRQSRIDVHDPWILLAAMAQATERVRLGTLVTPLARRRPWVVAKQVTTLDHVSGGRAILGVGLGEPADDDFAAFGERAERAHRASLLDEGLTVLDGLLRGPFAHAGEHYRVDSELLPRPVQRPRPPVWVGATAPHRRPLARATRWDGVVPLTGFEPPTPGELSDYLAGVERPPAWDVVAMWAPGVPLDEYAAAGATWLVEGCWPMGDWVVDLRARIAAGP